MGRTNEERREAWNQSKEKEEPLEQQGWNLSVNRFRTTFSVTKHFSAHFIPKEIMRHIVCIKDDRIAAKFPQTGPV